MSPSAAFAPNVDLASAIVSNPLTIRAAERVTDAITLFSTIGSCCDREHNAAGPSDLRKFPPQQSYLLVLEGQTLVGVVAEHDVINLVMQGHNPATITISEIMSAPGPTLQETDFIDLLTPLTLLHRQNHDCLPLLNAQGSIVGLLTYNSLHPLWSSNSLLHLLAVADTMIQPANYAAPSATLAELSQLLTTHPGKPILIGETMGSQLVPIGVVTASDLVQALALELDFAVVQAQSVMNPAFLTVRPEASLWAVQQLMQKGHNHLAIVTDKQGYLLGMITQTEILVALSPSNIYGMAEKLATERTGIIQAQLEREQLLTQIALKIQVSINLPEVLATTVTEVRSFLRCDRVLIYQYQSDWSGIVVAESVGQEWQSALGNRIADSCFQTTAAILYQEGRMIAVENVHTAGYSPCHLDLLEQYQVKANLFVPILVLGQLWGLLIGHQCDDYRSWQATDLTLLNEIGIQLAISIQQVRTYTQLQEEQKTRQQTETSLQASESELRKLFDAMDDVVLVFDREGTYLKVPTNCSKRLYRPREELLGRSLREVLPAAQAEFFLACIQQALTTGETQEYEYALLIEDTERWFNARCHPLTPETVLWVARDIHDQKMAECLLQEREQFLNSIYQDVEQAIFIVDVLDHGDFRLVDLNATAERITGQSASALRGKPAGEKVRHNYLNCVQSGTSITYEECLIFRDKPTWWITTLNPIRDHASHIYRIIGTSIEITQRKQAESLLELQNFTLERIARADPLSEILDALLSAMDLQLENALCSIMLCDQAGQLHCISAPQLPEAYIQSIAVVPIGEGAGSCGTAAFRQETVIVADIATDPLWQHYRELALPHGLRACWSVPIMSSDNQLLGTFAIYYRHCCAPLPQELEQVNQVVNIARIAIERDRVIQRLDQLNHDLENRVEERTTALQKSEQRYRALVNSASDAILLADAQGHLIEANQKAVELLGYSRDELMQMRVPQIHPPEVLEAVHQHFQSVMSRNQGPLFETLVLQKDGTLVPVDITASCIELEGEQIAQGILRDIRERKQIELALQESQRFIQQIADSSPNILYLYDIQSQKNIYVNHAITSILGYEAAEIQAMEGGFAQQLMHPHDLKFVFSSYFDRINSVEDGEVVATEYRLRHINGEWRWFYSRDTIFSRDENGQVHQVLGTAQDITDLKQTEAKLQQQADREQLTNIISQHIRESLNLQHILNTAVAEIHQVLQSDRVLVYQFLPNGSGTIIAEAVSLEWSPMVGQVFPQEFFPQEMKDRYTHEHILALSDCTGKDVLPCLSNFLNSIQVQAELVVQIVDNEKLWGLLIAHQCSEPRDWQNWEVDMLQQLSSQLAIAIQQSELYTQLQNSHQQLAHSNAELLRATRLKDEFLANMSHELRTPLNAILGMSESLQDEILGPLNKQQQKSIATIERSGQHLLALINDILELSKIEAGKLDLVIAPVSVTYLCKSSLAFINHQALKKQIQVQTNVTENMGEIVVDERRMRQVLINLLSNAVKFTPINGRIRLEIHFEPFDVNLTERIPIRRPADSAVPEPLWHQPQGHYINISVIDTGIGISEADQRKLFQPFIQIDSNLNRQYEGTGLGLALVKQIVERHGGDVTVTSALGQGSCFTVRLPANCLISQGCQVPPVLPSVPPHQPDQPPAPASDPAVQFQLQIAEPETSRPQPLLLLAEDNEANSATLSAYLQARGYRILLTHNGQEAIDMTKAHVPDLVLMDVQMPDVDGLQAIRQIRQAPDGHKIPIIAITALAMAGDRERCLEAGATEYRAKPVSLKELSHLIEQLLQQAE